MSNHPLNDSFKFEAQLSNGRRMSCPSPSNSNTLHGLQEVELVQSANLVFESTIPNAPREQRDWAPGTGSWPVGDTMHRTTANETHIDYTEIPSAIHRLPMRSSVNPFVIQLKGSSVKGPSDMAIFRAGGGQARVGSSVFEPTGDQMPSHFFRGRIQQCPL